jgi:hypothetical protein
VLPAYLGEPSPEACLMYLLRWTTDLVDALGVDAGPDQLQVTERIGPTGKVAFFDLPHLLGRADELHAVLDAIVYPAGTSDWFRVDVIDPPAGRTWAWHADGFHREFAHEHGGGKSRSTTIRDLDDVRTALLVRFRTGP